MKCNSRFQSLLCLFLVMSNTAIVYAMRSALISPVGSLVTIKTSRSAYYQVGKGIYLTDVAKSIYDVRIAKRRESTKCLVQTSR